MDITDEPTLEEIQTLIKTLDEEFDVKIKTLFGEFDIDVCKDEIKNSFEALKDSRNYNLILSTIKTNRGYLMTEMCPSEYLDMLSENVSKLKDILVEKGFNEKKLSSAFQKFLTPFEYRLLMIEGFDKQTLEVEEISKYKLCYIKHPKTYRLFNNTYFYNNFMTYAVAIMSVEKIFKTCVYNQYGFCNIIHLPITEDNHFGFYTLKNLDGVKRYWKMDCRLEVITRELSETLKTYCITLFRKIYKTCYGSNKYTVNFKSKNILEFDGEQILQNLFSCSNFIHFNTMITTTVRDYCSKQPTINDKFDFYTEDKEQSESFKQYKADEVEDGLAIVALLFDDMEEQTAKNFYAIYKK